MYKFAYKYANGKIVYKGVSDAWGLPFDEVETVLNELVH